MSSVSASKSKQGRVKNRYAQSAPANICAASASRVQRERGVCLVIRGGLPVLWQVYFRGTSKHDQTKFCSSCVTTKSN